jgi:hypothetical protein
MSRRARWAAVAAMLAGCVGFAFADTPTPSVRNFGPAIGDNKYQTKIESSGGVADADDYVGQLLAGDVLSASVTAAKRSKLRPQLELVGPDGVAVAVPGRRARGGNGVQFRHFAVPVSGAWTVRVTGASGTQGEYVVAFAVKAAPPQTVKAQRLGEDQPFFKTQPFHGLDGALLDFTLKWTKQSNPVELRALTDPSGADVLAADGKTAVSKVVTDAKKRTISLSKLPLHTGDGDYAVRVRISQGAALYDATFAVTPQNRPRGKRPTMLSSVEPFLDAPAGEVRGRPGFVLRLTGRNFSKSPRPRVFFGAVEGAVNSVSDDGTALDVVVPQGVPGTIVAVAVVNPDGQSAVRGGYFHYLQPIKVTDLVDDDGVQVRSLSARGGKRVHVKGENFEAGQTVGFGDAAATIVQLVSPREFVVLTPSMHQGTVPVVVTDVFGGLAPSEFLVRFKAPPTFGPIPYVPSVAAVNTEVEVLINGLNFQADDQLSFNGSPVASTYLGAQSRRFTVPALPAGAYVVTLTDEIGSVERGPDFTVKPPPTITAVSLVGGPHAGSTGLAAGGGTTVQVDGTDFHVSDAVTLNGAAVQFATHTTTRFTFVSPAGTLGAATLQVTDGANQTASLAGVLRYVGYADATSARVPASSAVDDGLADRGAVGDLDRDGKADDLVLVSSYYAAGTRTELTRVFLGDAAGKLQDVTATNFPATGSDTSAVDSWNASAVAIGDVDRLNGQDILIAGLSPYSYNGYVYKSIRLFRNDGTGAFFQDEANSPPVKYAPAVFARDQAGAYYLVYGGTFEGGVPTAMALGDIDHDAQGSLDLVVARDRYDFRYVGVDPTRVDFTQSPPYVATSNVAYLNYFQYSSATKVFQNDYEHVNGFVDRTDAWMPAVGSSTTAPVPCFQAKDLVLGDVDGDRSLDIVETWDDPTTVSAFGTYMGPNVDSPRTATRVLVNDGGGRFADATASWLPAPTAPEFWQANRCALGDFDGDLRPDLVLLHAQGTDAYNATPQNPASHSRSALRVLRNGGPGVGFVDATATALPAIPGAGDDFRGNALAVRDVDGDGRLDIVIGTTELLTDASGAPRRATRLFRGGPNFTFTLDDSFLVAAGADSGQTSDILFLGDLSGLADPTLLLLSNVAPAGPTGRQKLRAFDWKR